MDSEGARLAVAGSFNVDSVAAREERLQFEAALVAPLLKPLMAGMDSVGSYETDLFAREIAERLDPAR